MKRYFLLTSCISISLLGTMITDFSLGIWVLESCEKISSYTTIGFFAQITVVLGPLIGSFVDQWNKKFIIIFGQIIAGIGSIILLYLYINNMLVPMNIIIVTFICSISNAFVGQAFYVSAVELVPKDNLLQAKGIEQAGLAIIGLSVPIASPFLYKIVGLKGIFLFDIISFLISITLFLFVKFGKAPEKRNLFQFNKDAILVWNFFQSNMNLLYLLIYIFIINFFLGFFEALLAPMVIDISTTYSLGLIMSVACIGMLFGGISAGLYKKGMKKPIDRIIKLYFIIGLLLTINILHVSVLSISIILFLIVFFSTILSSINGAFWQTTVPINIQGRVLGYRNLVTEIAAPIACLMAGPIIDFVLIPFYKKYPLIKGYPGSDKTAVIVIVITISGLLILFISFWGILRSPSKLPNWPKSSVATIW